MWRTLTTVILICAAAHVVGAQAILENDQMRLEIIGLKRWTVPMIQDSLSRYAPKDSLMSHACAAVLRSTLKFADASVSYRETDAFGRPMKPYLAVTVVEPQDSALIRYRDAYRDSLLGRAEWATAERVFEKHNHAFQSAIQRPEFLSSRTPLRVADSAMRPALPLRRFLREHRTPRDQRLALATLASDGNWRNRVVAAVLLSNFAANDSAWWALADALRDPEGTVSATARQVMFGMRRVSPRTVNWAPATPTLRTILDGTNLFAHDEMMQVLAATRVDPSLARPLLSGGGFLVLAKLGAHEPTQREGARAFLVQVAGRDLGEDPASWRAWISGL
jgi:hypothetical protein